MLRNARVMWLAGSSAGDILTCAKHHRNGEIENGKALRSMEPTNTQKELHAGRSQ